MRDETDQWLQPLVTAAEERGIFKQPDSDVGTLMRQASMPAAEADTPYADWRARQPGPGYAVAVDWIRFGQILRERLGWHDYPEWPPGAVCEECGRPPGEHDH